MLEQSENEKFVLDNLFEKKSKVKYEYPYFSSSYSCSNASLGTIESDVSGKYGRWKKEKFRAEKLALLISNFKSIKNILDIGGGNLLASSFFVNNGFIVDVCDFETSPYLTKEALKNSGINTFINGDFNIIEFSKKYDLIWASHVLEHQLNIHDFILKILTLVSDNGYLAISVPPRKPFIVSGHINLFNPGLLIYRLVLAGLDCSNAKVFQCDGNICFFGKVKKVRLPKLNYDIGDIEILSKFFPNSPSDGFNGDFIFCNLSKSEVEMIYEGIDLSSLEAYISNF
tara:strand:+ start:218 stop:1072 length:855 start_codon:yes stop_codon:yes gene_type:complete